MAAGPSLQQLALRVQRAYAAGATAAALRSLSTARVKVSAPALDVAAYVGYAFVLVTATLLVRLLVPSLSPTARALQTLWASACSGVFIVKTVKRVIFSEARQHAQQLERRQSKHLDRAERKAAPLAW